MIHYETTIYERKENIPIGSVYVTSNGTLYAGQLTLQYC